MRGEVAIRSCGRHSCRHEVASRSTDGLHPNYALGQRRDVRVLSGGAGLVCCLQPDGEALVMGSGRAFADRLSNRTEDATRRYIVPSRRRVALRNLELCFPKLTIERREAIAREHFCWLGRSLLERGLLWYASPARLKRLIHIEGDVSLAERSVKPVMWLAPHFVALDVAGASTQLCQKETSDFDLSTSEQCRL